MVWGAPQACDISLVFEVVGKLIELIEIDFAPEPERMWNGPRRWVPARLGVVVGTADLILIP